MYSGDKIELKFIDEEVNYLPADMSLDIIYEDKDIIVLNKKPGRVVHPTIRHNNKTCANALKYYFEKNNIKRKIRFVNRLDMDTSGVMIVAKNPHAHKIISDEMKKGNIEKHYIAILESVVTKKRGVINEPIYKPEKEGEIMRIVHTRGKKAITEYEVSDIIEDKYTQVRVSLITGRTHQIRVHFSHIGHPVAGDALYGKESERIQRQALHCSKMKILHPRTRQYIEFNAELPDDMKFFIKTGDYYGQQNTRTGKKPCKLFLQGS